MNALELKIHLPLVLLIFGDEYVGYKNRVRRWL